MKVTVIGAGFSGLVTAYYLRKRGLEVEIVDKAPKAGGLISTAETDFGLVESAANGLMNSELVEDLFTDLGLLLTPMRKQSKKRYIFRNKPKQWPLSIFESISFFFLFGFYCLFGFQRSLRPKPHETISQWAERKFGKSFLKYLIGPALQGIYAGDVNRMSASLILNSFFNRTKPNRKLVAKGTVAPRKGMGQLIYALTTWLKDHQVNIQYDTEVVWDPKVKEWKWVIATSAPDAARILGEHKAGEYLNSIEVSPVVSVTAFFHPLDAKTKGFGILFPRDQGVRALGVLFNNEIFEGRSDYRSETWIYGGATDHEICEYSEPELMSQLLKDRKAVERGISKPLHFKIQRWPTAIPHYTVNLEKTLEEIPEIPNTYLIGNYLGGLGLSKIVERAFHLSEQIAMQDRSSPIIRKVEKVEERFAIH
jgi:protoporphyrinogen/coproporphyrinogen III oxidase